MTPFESELDWYLSHRLIFNSTNIYSVNYLFFGFVILQLYVYDLNSKNTEMNNPLPTVFHIQDIVMSNIIF